MTTLDLTALSAGLREISPLRKIGRVARICDGRVEVTGLDGIAALGDQVEMQGPHGAPLRGEIMRIDPDCVHVVPEGDLYGFTVQAPAVLKGPFRLAPCDAWIGRILDSAGRPLDGRPAPRGPEARTIQAAPPPAGPRREKLKKLFGAERAGEEVSKLKKELRRLREEVRALADAWSA